MINEADDIFSKYPLKAMTFLRKYINISGRTKNGIVFFGELYSHLIYWLLSSLELLP